MEMQLSTLRIKYVASIAGAATLACPLSVVHIIEWEDFSKIPPAP